MKAFVIFEENRKKIPGNNNVGDKEVRFHFFMLISRLSLF